MFKKFLATATMLAMMTGTFGMSAYAAEWNTEGGEAYSEGSNYVVEAAFEVELPGDLAFAINPMYLDVDDDGTAENSQIVSGDYYFINHSNVPVLVTTETWASNVGTNINYLTDLTAVEWDATTKELKANASADKKNVALLITLPKVEYVSDAVKLTPATFTKGTSVAADVDGYMLSNVEASKNKIQFKLAKGADTITTAQIGAFQFSGAVDPNKTYEDAEIEVVTTFTVNALTADQYTNGYDALKPGANALDASITAVTPKSGS